jgi:AcrR family transcriptional regulator/DNA-binding MarR family transcriptional regulator
MSGKEGTPSKRAASDGLGPAYDGLAPARNGLAPARDGLALGRDPVFIGTGGLGRERDGFGRERMGEIQRVRILGAMVEVAAERGAGNVTVAHVVERAGVSRRTFYELFSDREECFLAAFDDGIARASRYVLDAYDPRAGWAERIRTALIGLLCFLDAERGIGQLLIVGSLGAGHRALERRRRSIAQITSLIDEGRTLTGTGKESKTGDELPPLTAEGIAGGVLSILHSRLLDSPSPAMRGTGAGIPPLPAGGSLLGLTGPLMGMIVLPYLGPAAARKELARPVPKMPANAHRADSNPLSRLEMRLTYRTVRVLMAIAARPGSSNRIVADAAEVSDQGQMSKLLARLQQLGLIENTGGGASRGEPNAWTLTDKGWQVQTIITEQTSRD